MDESTPFFPSSSQSTEEQPIFQDRVKNKRTKTAVYVFLGLVAVFIVVTIICSSVQAWKVTPLFILLPINVLAIGQVLIFVTYFVFTDRLAKKWFWAIFLIGVFVIIESISTDILVFTIQRS